LFFESLQYLVALEDSKYGKVDWDDFDYDAQMIQSVEEIEDEMARRDRE